MEKRRRFAAVLCAAVLAAGMTVPASADWEEDKDGVYYYDEDGSKVKGLKEIDGETYYFDRKGVMQTGWQTIRGHKCYFRKDGSMIKGRAKIGKKSYYFDEDGYLTSGNIIVGGKIYMFYESGKTPKLYKNALVEVDEKLYCTDSKGALKKGLQKVGDNYYYFGSKGYSETAEVEQDGIIYTLDADYGLVMMTKAPVDASKINIKVGTYSDTATTLTQFKCSNNKDGDTFNYSGWITNVAGQPSCRVRVYAELYNEDKELIDTEKMVTTSNLKIGDKCQFEGHCMVWEPVYSVKFVVERVS